MSLRHFSACLLLAVVTVVSAAEQQGIALDGAQGSRPNVVLILADDLGLECVGAYGGQSYQTRNIDRLAETGVRFEMCFSNPYCSPSRGELLTGREPLHTGIPRVIFDPATHREFLDPTKQQSIANLFQDAGYVTAMAGKWQLSFLHERDTIRDFGFDEYQAWQIFRDSVKTSRFANPSLRVNGQLNAELVGGYGPDENCRFVTEFISKHQSDPFFVYYACLLPHWPWEPTPASGKPLKPANGVGDSKYFPDMVAYLDTIVGRITDHLDTLGLRENTIVMFVADNGTDRRLQSEWSDGIRDATVDGGKGTMTDAGTHVPLIVNWRGHISASVNKELVELCDVMPSLVDLCRLAQPRYEINGVSFSPLLGFGETDAVRQGTRRWIHAQNVGSRHVRSRSHILTNRGELRPVVPIGEKSAKAIVRPLSTEEAEIRQELKAGLRHVEEFTQPALHDE